MLKDETYYVGHRGESSRGCSAMIDGVAFKGLPCETLWIKEGCTLYSQPYVVGQTLPQWVLIAGSLPNGDNIYVASVYTPNLPTRYPGYYIVTNGYTQSRYFQSERFNILIVL